RQPTSDRWQSCPHCMRGPPDAASDVRHEPQRPVRGSAGGFWARQRQGFDRNRARIVFTPTAGNLIVTFSSAPCPCQARTSPTPNDGWRSLLPTCNPGPAAASPSYSTVSSPGLRRAPGIAATGRLATARFNGYSGSSRDHRPPQGPRPSLESSVYSGGRDITI